MLSRTTLARPYARAAFEAAHAAGALSSWSAALDYAARIAGSEEMRALIGDPRVGDERLMALIADLGQGRFDEPFSNFLRLVIANDRLALMPEIAALFEQYRRSAEDRIRVEMRSARPVDKAQFEDLTRRLAARFGRAVDLQVEVDETLIGGAVIRAGDKVIDGSVRGRLEQLGRQISA